MPRSLNLLPLLACLMFLAACVSTVPDGQGSISEEGEERDPGEMLTLGTVAPDFSVPDENGTVHSLEDYVGEKYVVLIFYPGNDTPGCTQQLCAVRDDWNQFQRGDTMVFGVNPADGQSHASFSEKYGFPFPLLSDQSGDMTRAYGARGAMGIVKRTVYIIGKDGRIIYAERGMPSNDRILSSLPALDNPASDPS